MQRTSAAKIIFYSLLQLSSKRCASEETEIVLGGSTRPTKVTRPAGERYLPAMTFLTLVVAFREEYLKNISGSNFKRDTWRAHDTVSFSHTGSANVLISV